MKRLNPPQIIILSFLAIISCGTFFLSLPQAVKSGESLSLIDAFFTATSATCVTGLIIKDTGSYFSHFGQMVIMVLFQIGGLGIMSFSTFFAILLGKKLTIRQNVVVQSALDHHAIEGLSQLVIFILMLTFGIELIGAGLLFFKIRLLPDMGFSKSIYYSLFHSISAFCNAGFSLYTDSFKGFKSDVFINFVMMSLIIIGGLGFVVLLDVPKIRYLKKGTSFFVSKISLQTKIVLVTTSILILAGAIVIFVIERNNILVSLSWADKWLVSLFQSVTSRTAGFNTVSIMGLKDASLFFIIILMFIGASPGSTGGGIKTVTFAILVASVISMRKNKSEVSIFKRVIPRLAVRRTIVVFVLALAWIMLVTLILNITEAGSFGERSFLKILFETVSAFGTVGLSTGITEHLSVIGKFLIAVTIFIGRLGLLTVALAVALGEEKSYISYPEERVMVG
ncbi:MAG: TrkH family potassium uptake protein [Candidatus Omnitrophota bacterium]